MGYGNGNNHEHTDGGTCSSCAENKLATRQAYTHTSEALRNGMGAAVRTVVKPLLAEFMASTQASFRTIANAVRGIGQNQGAGSACADDSPKLRAEGEGEDGCVVVQCNYPIYQIHNITVAAFTVTFNPTNKFVPKKLTIVAPPLSMHLDSVKVDDVEYLGPNGDDADEYLLTQDNRGLPLGITGPNRPVTIIARSLLGVTIPEVRFIVRGDKRKSS